MRMFRYFAVSAAASLLSVAALAAPGWTVTGLTVLPSDAPKVVAALDALFASEVGKKAPGRVVLRANLADGDEPETHTVVSLAASAEEREAFQNELWASEAWTELTSSISSVNQEPGTTMRGMIVWNHGDRSDDDVIWRNHYFTVREPQAMMAAMQAYTQSPGGQAQPSQVHLSFVVAGGAGGPSHIVSVGYASEAEMEASIVAQAQDPAWQALVRTLGAVAVYHGATLQRDLKAWGPASVEAVSDTGN